MSTFPAGLRVLVVDDDFTCLSLLEELLRACQYQVTKCQRAADALSLLRGDGYGFDIVLTDIFMPEMDGFQLLEIIRLEMDYLPVVVMSSDERKDVVLKAVKMGACDYLMKPVRMQEISVIWQHVVRKQRNDLHSLMLLSKFNQNPGNAGGDEYRNESRSPIENCASSTQERREEELQEIHKTDILSMKKPRMIWTPELHQQFVAAVNHIGLANAVPKKILEHMKVAGLTRENVASHLQKYRLFLRRKKEASLVHHYQDSHPPSLLHGQVYVSPTQFPSQTSTPTHTERLGVSSSIYHGCSYNQTFSAPSMIQATHQENCQGIQQINREQAFDEYATSTIPMPCTRMIDVKPDLVTKSAGTYECTFQESQQLEDQCANMNFYLCTSYEHPFFCSTS